MSEVVPECGKGLAAFADSGTVAGVRDVPYFEGAFAFRRKADGEDILLSPRIWNGAASRDLFEIVSKDPQTKREEAGGYYVRRLS